MYKWGILQSKLTDHNKKSDRNDHFENDILSHLLKNLLYSVTLMFRVSIKYSQNTQQVLPLLLFKIQMKYDLLGDANQ